MGWSPGAGGERPGHLHPSTTVTFSSATTIDHSAGPTTVHAPGATSRGSCARGLRRQCRLQLVRPTGRTTLTGAAAASSSSTSRTQRGRHPRPAGTTHAPYRRCGPTGCLALDLLSEAIRAADDSSYARFKRTSRSSTLLPDGSAPALTANGRSTPDGGASQGRVGGRWVVPARRGGSGGVLHTPLGLGGVA